VGKLFRQGATNQFFTEPRAKRVLKETYVSHYRTLLVYTRDRPIYRPGRYYRPIFGFYRYIGIGLSRCWQNAVIFLKHADNLRTKVHRTKSRQLSCSNANRCIFRQDEPWSTRRQLQPKQNHHH